MYVATLHGYMETNSTTSHTNIYTDYHSWTNLTKYRIKKFIQNQYSLIIQRTPPP